MRRRRTEKILRAVRPNAGLRAKYRRVLLEQIDAMHDSYRYWLAASYRRNPPRLAQDETPAGEFERELRKLGRRWEKNFDKMSRALGRHFATQVHLRSDAAIRKTMKEAGWTVEMPMTPAMRDVLGATIAENVALVKSIPAQFHTQVEGIVMRSVTTGRDLKQLTDDLEKQFGVTRRRAEFIALDQSNKATNQLSRVRYQEMGIEEGIWLHSGGGKEPRPTHKANHGKRFNIQYGWFDPDPKVREHILPGYLPRCRCSMRPVVAGFS